MKIHASLPYKMQIHPLVVETRRNSTFFSRPLGPRAPHDELWCYFCKQPLPADCVPCGLPIKTNRNQHFILQNVYCSIECVRSYMLDDQGIDSDLALLGYMSRVVYGRPTLRRRPAVSQLIMFGGHLTANEFLCAEPDSMSNSATNPYLEHIYDPQQQQHWLLPTSHCWHCCHPAVHGIPCVMQLDKHSRQRTVQGFYCSLACCRAQISADGGYFAPQRLVWSFELMRELGHLNSAQSVVVTAPSRWILQVFGGILSIEAFRNRGADAVPLIVRRVPFETYPLKTYRHRVQGDPSTDGTYVCNAVSFKDIDKYAIETHLVESLPQALPSGHHGIFDLMLIEHQVLTQSTADKLTCCMTTSSPATLIVAP
jgi:hypothetical protein